MSKRKNIIRVGDRVKILVPDVVVRVGYPLTKADMMEKQTPEQLKAIQDMFRAFGIVMHPDMFTDYKSISNREDDRAYGHVRRIMASLQLRREGWGGRERRIHTHTLPMLRGCLATVDAKRVVKTGDYHPGWSGQDYWTGEYDCEPAYLSNEKTHVLYKLYVDGIGYSWTPDSENSISSDYKDIEIEAVNLAKIDPSKPVIYDDEGEEHPSGLGGEHSVVLDAIHQECLHGR